MGIQRYSALCTLSLAYYYRRLASAQLHGVRRTFRFKYQVLLLWRAAQRSADGAVRRRGGRLRAITFDIRNYSSADGGAGEAGSADIPSPWGRTKRSRVASAGLAAVAQRAVWQSPWTHSAPTLTSPSRARISHTLPKCTLALAGSCWLLPNTHC